MTTHTDCPDCARLTLKIKSPDVLESKLAESCYVLHLKKEHGLSSLAVLQKTGVWVEL
jgi:hypothetical protein